LHAHTIAPARKISYPQLAVKRNQLSVASCRLSVRACGGWHRHCSTIPRTTTG
jgi:hypothetical protein